MLKRRPAGGRCAAVLGRRTPDGGRARIAELLGRTASSAAPRQLLATDRLDQS